MPLRIIRTLITAAAASLLVISCGGEESTPESQATGAQSGQPRQGNTIVEKMDPDGKGMHLTATSPTGKTYQASIGDEIEVPDAFPKDVPIFPESTPMASLSAPDGFIVTFKSGEEQQDVFDFYQAKLAEGGWEIEKPATGADPMSIDATKEDRRISVVIGGRKGDSRVSIVIGAKE